MTRESDLPLLSPLNYPAVCRRKATHIGFNNNSHLSNQIAKSASFERNSFSDGEKVYNLGLNAIRGNCINTAKFRRDYFQELQKLTLQTTLLIA